MPCLWIYRSRGRNLLSYKNKEYKSAQWDYLAREVLATSRVTPLFAVYMSPALALFAMYHEIDPIHFALHWLPLHLLPTLVRYGIRLVSLVLLTMAGIVIGQVLLGMGYMIIMAVWTCREVIHLMDSEQRRGARVGWRGVDQMRLVIQYNRLVILISESESGLALGILLVLGGSFLVIVMCNVMTITMYELYPIHVYILAPLFSGIMVCVVNVVWKYVAQVELISREMLRRWRNDYKLVASGTMPEIGRRVGAMRSILLYMGMFDFRWFPVDMETQCNYNAAIIERTISFLLALKN
ncbi:uncharacterized protein LOC110850237 isoform X1 [Folsomia candida]|uniref:uncharacterized protein LOC110850237 isoform X1 n=2 Tax=Folsomia candida TaxID=158441 RepID=UPI001604C95A|nr:uncharacterized protein LOC110850237 isoform X1 [Folsomia candida]